ncbi:putative Ig domain-containing protein [Comamonas sp. SY3]|uniref:putative Ig domain-containing protein n=1 Tax=Comamonas sp. SY3 TaxID=3243601 RepID=UPI0035936BAC
MPTSFFYKRVIVLTALVFQGLPTAYAVNEAPTEFALIGNHLISTKTGQDTAPTVNGTASNPTFTEKGAAVALFNGIATDTHDSGQTFTGAQFNVSNVAGSSEYLTINGVKVDLSNGNSISLGSGYGAATVSVSGGLATFDKVVLLTVVDDIAPSYDQAPAISNATAGGFTISGSLSEAGTFYYVVVPDGASAPTATQIIAGQNASGSYASASGFQILSAPTYDFSLVLSGLAASTMYDVYVVAKDSANNTSSVIKVDVTTASVNNPPVVSIPVPALSAAQSNYFSFIVPAGTFADPDGDTLALTATLIDGSPLPAWLTFNATTGTFSGTPSNANVGLINIKLTATDSGNASVSTTLSLTVTNVNDAPVVATPIPVIGVLQDTSLNFTVPAGTFVDPDGDTLTLSATLADGSALPAWLTFNTATRTFSGKPGPLDLGNLSIKVTASDGDASVSTIFTLQVTNSVAPKVVSVVLPANGRYAEGETLEFSVIYTEPVIVDASQGSPRLAITLDTGGIVYAQYAAGSDTEQLLFRYTVAAGQHDTNGITLAGNLDFNGATIRDLSGNDAEQMFHGVGTTDGILIGAPVVPAMVAVPVDSPIGLALLAGTMAWLGLSRSGSRQKRRKCYRRAQP